MNKYLKLKDICFVFVSGHSVGELGCAYADGCLTTEEMILSAYSRGLVSVQTPFIRGSMAAVGIGYQEVDIHYIIKKKNESAKSAYRLFSSN